MLKYRIPHNSKLDGMTLIDVSNQLNCEILISAVERKKELIIPNWFFSVKRERYNFISLEGQTVPWNFSRKIGKERIRFMKQ